MDRGTDSDRVQVDPVQPALAASSHPCLLKDHGREPESLISSGRGSLLAGFHPGIPCSFFPGGTVPVTRYLWEAQVLRHSWDALTMHGPKHMGEAMKHGGWGGRLAWMDLAWTPPGLLPPQAALPVLL